MSKRTDAIRSLFIQPPAAPALSADNIEPAPRRVASGAVRTVRETFSTIERENETLRAQLSEGERLVEIDPALIDASPVADRFAHEDDASFEALKASIAERGQEIPVLLRPHPTEQGRYQTAFGHRRIRALRQLGRPVKALVRPLDDDALVIAQGVENAAREDLSFIERALFALRLEQGGRARAIVQQALAIDRAEASKLISVAKAVPDEVIRAIGRAPKIGRRRWQELAEALADPAALARVRAAAGAGGFTALESDERFARALAAANRKEVAKAAGAPALLVKDSGGRVLAQIRPGERDVKVVLASASGSAFARYLTERLPGLFEEFHASGAHQGGDEA